MKYKIFNRKELLKNRRMLRNKSTRAEIILWNYLRGKQLIGRKFRRQYSIGKNIVDFYSPKDRLAVELDGESHYNDRIYLKDKLKEKFLNDLGIRLIRFEDEMVFKSLEKVLEAIKKNLTAPFSPP
ncbi:DUF559 domain-containing protein [Candidatus Roizmanbacteria bacterium]|nr:DUF559 domain-containing protein [Candidatus Roizmanbacteria bacterium]